MTRAADRLVVAGSRGVNRIPDGCWYQLIERALKPDAIEEPADDGDGVVLRWRKDAADVIAQGAAASAPAAAHELPAWLKRNAPAETDMARAISPSRTDAPGGRAKYLDADPRALARGRTVHRLLQALPGNPARKARRRRAATSRTREGPARSPNASPPRCSPCSTMHALHPLFAENSRAEVPIVGIVSHGEQRQKVSGQVDRLAVTPTEVLIADYKSDRTVPDTIGDVPPAISASLRSTARCCGSLYPNHQVRAALVWTAGPALTELPAALLDACVVNGLGQLKHLAVNAP